MKTLLIALMLLGVASAQITFYPPVSTQPFASIQNAGTDVVCAKGSDTISGLTCNNSADATTATPFSSTVTIPAGTLSNNSTIANILIGFLGSGTAALGTISFKLGNVVIYTSGALTSNNVNSASLLACSIMAAAAASATTPIIASCAVTSGGQLTHNTLITATNKSIAVDTTVAQILSVTISYNLATVGNAAWLYSISPGGR